MTLKSNKLTATIKIKKKLKKKLNEMENKINARNESEVVQEFLFGCGTFERFHMGLANIT